MAEAGTFGLRAGSELPGEAIYRAHMLADAIMVREIDGELVRDVEPDAVMPLSPLQSPEEMAAWMAAEAARLAQGSKVGVQLGADRRDWVDRVCRPSLERGHVETGEAPLQGMGERPTADELAKAVAALHDHNRRVNPKNKRDD